ncbi:hypothetical protein F5Y08DRAFT_324569 [Xylaria arbuscula]|nr:hypothetical protein F5Y08DRAFT_324569 [Xylaria arbuscula]
MHRRFNVRYFLLQFADCCSQEIRPARGALEGAQDFLSNLLPRLGAKVRIEFDSIINHNKGSRKSGKESEEELIRYINSLPFEQLSNYMNFRMNEMRSAGDALSQRRSRGFHKGATRLQDLTVTFNQFLRAYSGVVSIVQNADAQFGNVAFAALSLLFATLKAKAEEEASIQSCMLHISDRMPDFEVYSRIYPDPKLGLMLSEAYRDVIIFARKATIYFQAHGSVRYLRQFRRVAEFQLMEKQMRDTSNRISEKCNVLLAEKIDHLANENKMLLDRENERVIREMVKSLKLEDYRTEDMHRNLEEEQLILRHQSGSNRRLQRMDAQHFLDTIDGQRWEHPGRVLMLLFGRNEKSSSSNHSWLSLVATELAEKHFKAGDSIAYESLDRGSTLQRTLSRLIFQLLERNPALVQQAEDYREIQSQIDLNGKPYERDSVVEGLRKALIRIIDRHNSPVYIILNRLELCEMQSEESCTEYLATMLSLARDTRKELKVMIIVKSELWDFKKNENEFRSFEGEMFCKVRMDQGRSSAN